MLQPHTIQISPDVYSQLEKLAKARKKSVDVYAEEALQMSLPKLPQNIEYELSLLAALPDDVLLLVVDNAWSQVQAERLAELNSQLQREGDLSKANLEEQAKLGDAYERGISRRTQAIELLRRRGYNLSDLLQR